MRIPEELRYSKDHEWVRTDGAVARIGITDFAQDALGDIVYVSMPEVGSQVAAGATIGEVESTKSVSEVYAPVTGVVRVVNTALTDAPEVLNADPYGEGWICELELTTPDEVAALLDAAAYTQLTDS